MISYYLKLGNRCVQHLDKSWVLSASLILILGILTFGIRLSRLGIYETDWVFFNVYHNGGGQAVLHYQSIDRLLAGLPFALVFEVFGDNVLFWHMTVIIIHLATGLLILSIWRRLFPQYSLLAPMSAALFVVYPAVETLSYFSQILSSTSVFLTLLSSYLLLRMVYKTRVIILLLVLTALLNLTSLLIYELPLGLTLAQLLLLGISLSRILAIQSKVFWMRILLLYSPTALSLVIFLFWRLVLYPSFVMGSRLAPYETGGLAAIVSKIVRNYTILLIYTWREALVRLFDSNNFWLPWFPWLLLALTTSLVLCAKWLLTHPKLISATLTASADTTQSLWLPFVTGLLMTGLGFASSLPTSFAIPLPNNLFSRIDLASTPGAALTLVAGSLLLSRALVTRWQNLATLLVASLIGLATVSSFLVEEQFVNEWSIQQQIWWQLTWRAPALRAGAYVLLVGPQSSNALHRPFNDYEVANVLGYLYNNSDLAGEQVIDETLTRFTLTGLNTMTTHERVPLDHLLVAQYGNGCLKITPNMISPSGDPLLDAVEPFSNVINIVPAQERSPALEKILGSPSTNTWCYFYENAEWERQQHQWKTIVDLYNLTTQHNLTPSDPGEWSPFIEGLARQGAYKSLDGLMLSMRTAPSPESRQMIRTLFEKLQQDGSQEGNEQLAKYALKELENLH